MQKILYFVGGIFLFLGSGLLASFAAFKDSQRLELVTSPLSPAALVFTNEGHYFVCKKYEKGCPFNVECGSHWALAPASSAQDNMTLTQISTVSKTADDPPAGSGGTE